MVTSILMQLIEKSMFLLIVFDSCICLSWPRLWWYVVPCSRAKPQRMPPQCQHGCHCSRRCGHGPGPATAAANLDMCCPFDRSIFRSFDRSIVRSFVRSFDRSIVRSFERSIVWSFDRSIVQSFDRSFVRSFDRSFVLARRDPTEANWWIFGGGQLGDQVGTNWGPTKI